MFSAFLEEVGVSLSKRRSCELVETSHPCVKKALFHLQNLKGILKRGGKVLEKDRMRGDKEIAFLGKNEEMGDAGCDLVRWEEGDMVQLEKQAREAPIYHLKSYEDAPKEVFRQVTELILRLEEDRSKTEKALVLERKRLDLLNDKLSDMMIKRLTILPQVVQREHEACARNLGELDFNVANNVSKRGEGLTRLNEAKKVNNGLRSDIEFIKAHCPRVEEKLKAEKEAMKVVKKKQVIAEKKLHVLTTNLRTVEANYQREVQEGEMELEKCNLHLQVAQDELHVIQEKYRRAQLMEKAYTKKSIENRQKIVDLEEETTNLHSRIVEAKEEELEENEKLERLTERKEQVDKEGAHLTARIKQVEETIRKTTETNEKAMKQLTGTHSEKVAALKKLEETNKNLEIDVEELNVRCVESEKMIATSKAECDRFDRELQKNEEKIEFLQDKVDTIKEKNSQIQEQIDKEDAITKDLEDVLKAKCDKLQKQLNEEMRQRQLYEGRHKLNLKNFGKIQTENRTKKARLEKDLLHNTKALEKATADLQVTSAQHEIAEKELQHFQAQMQAVQEEHGEVKTDLTAKQKNLEVITVELKKEQKILKEELVVIEKESDELRPQIGEIVASKDVVSSRLRESESKIILITKELEEVTLKYDGKQQVVKMLKEQIEDATTRLSRRASVQRDITRRRGEVHSELHMGAKKQLKFNSNVATGYRNIQSLHLDLKNRMVKLYDEKLMFETGMKDYMQLVEMQKKLNWALSRYFENRNNFNEVNLNNFKLRSQNNTEAIRGVQGGLVNCVKNIETFLESHIDGSAQEEVREAGIKVLRFPLKEPLPPLTADKSSSSSVKKSSLGSNDPIEHPAGSNDPIENPAGSNDPIDHPAGSNDPIEGPANSNGPIETPAGSNDPIEDPAGSNDPKAENLS